MPKGQRRRYWAEGGKHEVQLAQHRPMAEQLGLGRLEPSQEPVTERIRNALVSDRNSPLTWR